MNNGNSNGPWSGPGAYVFWRELARRMETGELIQYIEEQEEEKDESRIKITRMDTVKMQPLLWTWQDRIPSGTLTLLVGDPGIGKSTVSLDIAARISTGTLWPCSEQKAERGNVILLGTEDSLSRIVGPRLTQHGADLARIHVFESVMIGEEERDLDLASDLDRIKKEIEKIRPRVMIVDPISDYLGNKDSYKDSEVRSFLRPLTNMAERYDMAIIAIVHMTKTVGGKALYRALGSIGFVGKARSAIAIGKDPQDPERRLFVPFKSNYAPLADALAYRLPEGRVDWEEKTIAGMTAETVLGEGLGAEEQADRRSVEDFLKTYIKPGETVSSNDLMRDGDMSGFSERQIKYMLNRLGFKWTQKDRKFYWTRPDELKNNNGEHVQETQYTSQYTQSEKVYSDVNPSDKASYTNDLRQYTQNAEVYTEMYTESPIRQKAIKKMGDALKVSGHDERLKKWMADNSDTAFASRDSGVLLESVPATALDPATKNKARLVIKRKEKK